MPNAYKNEGFLPITDELRRICLYCSRWSGHVEPGGHVGTFWRQTQGIKRDSGFTIIELMVVVLILGVLMLIAVASYSMLADRAAEAACISNQRTLNGAIQIYRGTRGSLTSTFTLGDLEGYATTWDVITVCPLDKAPLVFDSATESIICPNHPFD